MRSATSLMCACTLALALGACSDSKSDAQAGTTFCFNCHSETTDLGQKILWAESGYDTSVHKLGQVERDYTQLAATAPTASGAGRCVVAATVTQTACGAGNYLALGFTWDATANSGNGGCVAPAAVNQNACDTVGGTWGGPRWILSGAEHTGSNADYANSTGCQMCHTQEGFRKRVSGAYDDDGKAAVRFSSIKFGWDPNASQGSPTSASATPPVIPTPLDGDTIEYPSPVGCFTCHTPHGIGTTDNEHLDQTIPVGTAITTQVGSVYGNGTTGIEKSKGHMCAECHQVRVDSQPSVIKLLSASLTGSGAASVSATFGPHHGPQTDMLLGAGGAQYAGTATHATSGQSATFAGTYGNSAHTGLPAADCVTCHMQSDYTDISVAGRFGVNPAVGGHAFTNKGFVHGAETALVLGCGSRDGAMQCHSVAAVPSSGGNLVKAATLTTTNGYLMAGDAIFQKYADAAGTTDSGYQLKVNELLVKLANPGLSCAGLLADAARVANGGAASQTWSRMADGTVDPHCVDAGAKLGTKLATVNDDNSVAGLRYLKALYNFKYVGKEDKSFGVHNTRYALELLYDSCVDLAILTGQAATYCNGTYVTARP